MAKQINLEDALHRMSKHTLIDMSAASNFDITFLSRLRSGVYHSTKFEKYINLLNYLYHDTKTENSI